MAGYVKSWTDIFDDEWFIGLSNYDRGIWLQLIIYAKVKGDTGHIFERKLRIIADIFAADVRILRRSLTLMHEHGKVVFLEDNAKVSIQIVKYYEYQRVKQVKGNINVVVEPKKTVQVLQKCSINAPISREEKSREEQSREYNPHTDFLEFIKKNKKRIFDRLSQIAFRLLGSEQELWDRTVLGTVVTWIRENPEKASASLMRVHSGDWLLFIERWVWRDWKKKNDEINRNRGMSRKVEQDHHAQARIDGREPLPAAVSEIVNKVFEKEN